LTSVSANVAHVSVVVTVASVGSVVDSDVVVAGMVVVGAAVDVGDDATLVLAD
jgi:hypothetical protein